ncbi:VOC family protein [Roseivirga sp. BDSF3-8]|uniref:VOC family protein n=1 Tax=Roseivirga sp. BDSF3-8 TaxID=3241598 RepID=UPI003531C93C
MEQNIAGWFEIPVTDMVRAIAFYEKILDVSMERHQMGELDMAWFPYAPYGKPGAAGSLVKHPAFYKPSHDGTLIYLSAPSGNLATELARVPDAGGKIVEEKKLIADDIGYMGIFIDSEGNRVALHSNG